MVMLRDAYYAPDVQFTLISMSRITKASFAVHFEGSWCEISTTGPKRKTIAKIPKANGLYRLTGNYTPGETANAVRVKMSIDELHRKMGHISVRSVEHMVKSGLVEGIELDSKPASAFCEACTKAKITRATVPKTRSIERTATSLGERIHSDEWGPAQVEALGGEHYFVSFTDKAKAWSEMEALKSKGQAFKAYKDYEAWLANQHGVSIKEFHCDGGGEFINKLFNNHLKAKGTKRTTTVHDTPEQNGIAERLNRTILENARAMIITAGLPRFLWVEAVRHSFWLKNRSPTRALNGMTPHEAMGYGKPDLSDLHEWGCTVWIKVEAGKLDSKAVEAKFMGYDKERKGYRVYWPEKRKISVERNVRFVPDEILIPETTQSEGVQVKQAIPVVPSVPETLEQQQPPDGLDPPLPNTG